MSNVFFKNLIALHVSTNSPLYKYMQIQVEYHTEQLSSGFNNNNINEKTTGKSEIQKRNILIWNQQKQQQNQIHWTRTTLRELIFCIGGESLVIQLFSFPSFSLSYFDSGFLCFMRVLFLILLNLVDIAHSAVFYVILFYQIKNIIFLYFFFISPCSISFYNSSPLSYDSRGFFLFASFNSPPSFQFHGFWLSFSLCFFLLAQIVAMGCLCWQELRYVKMS